MNSSGPCKCDVLERLQGEAARNYARHLTLEPVPLWFLWLEDRYSPDGISEWTCATTGWKWHGTPGSAGWELRRRPRTFRSDYLSVRTIEERAAAIVDAHRDIYAHVGRDQERWRVAALRAWTAREALYSPDWWLIVEDLRLGEPSAVEPSLVFLEADPWCFRSGYAKERLLRFLRRHSLSVGQTARLEDALIAATLAGPRREFPLTAKLARHLASEHFAAKIHGAAGRPSTSDEARRHLARLLPAENG
jgi:hypothetical protein